MTADQNHLLIEARILQKLDEPFAAGLYEARNASPAIRWARAIRRYAETVPVRPGTDDDLCPSGELHLWRLSDAAVWFNYSYSLGFASERLRGKIESRLTCEREKRIADRLVQDLETVCAKPLAVRYRVGGQGYTHSILDYHRILTDGLPEYGRRIARGRAAADSDETAEFYDAMRDVFTAVMLLLGKVADSARNPDVQAALTVLAERPPRTFHEAMLLLNFMFYVDGCDSIGALDRYLSPFYERDRADGMLTESAAEALLAQFFANVDMHSGWHMILGGEGASEAFTILCLRAQKTRRPNTGLKITPATSDAVWQTAFDALRKGTANPSFYNDGAYRKGAVEFAGVQSEDLHRIAYGGCTEFMVEGRSNVGSIDAGINLLRILEGTLLAELDRVESFEQFMDSFRRDIRRQIDEMAGQVNLNQQYKAIYRPQLIRTLFIEDCLERAAEYNDGGARYNGAVINVAGIANVANSLVAVKAVLEGTLNIAPDRLGEALAANFEGFEELHRKLLALPRFGNNVEEVDLLAQDICKFTFDRITRHRCWRGAGFMIPSTIMFVTYVDQGVDIDATPDGRYAGTAIADSCGPMQGTDAEGPTSMLSSAALLPQVQGLGTMILNLRVSAKMFSTPQLRQKLKQLLSSYFNLGGMQIQLTVLDAAQLQDALENPDAHENLIVRIGGYTEYFNRLGDTLKREVIKRTEYL